MFKVKADLTSRSQIGEHRPMPGSSVLCQREGSATGPTAVAGDEQAAGRTPEKLCPVRPIGLVGGGHWAGRRQPRKAAHVSRRSASALPPFEDRASDNPR
jgi:hypothetical protein